MSTTLTTEQAISDAFVGTEHIHPVYVSMALERLAEQMVGTVDRDSHPDRKQEVINLVHELLVVADRLTGRPNNESRHQLVRSVHELEFPTPSEDSWDEERYPHFREGY